MKLYQNRHPDSSASSVKAYVVLGLAIMLEAISIYYGNSPWFWGIFCFIYILSIVCVVANIYQLDSKNKMDLKTNISAVDKFMFLRVYYHLFTETKKALTGQSKGKKTRPLLVFISVTCIINVALCIFFGVEASLKDVTASNFLLYLFMINMFIYLKYYVFMKYQKNEKLHWKTKCYAGELIVYFSSSSMFMFCCVAVCGAICTVPALYFFVMKEKNSNVSPAESRELNRPCQLFKFYDG